jgi:O-Antigen ligase
MLRQPSGRRRWGWVIAGGLAFGALAGYLGTSGSAARILMLAIVLLPLLLWKRPYLAPAVLLSSAVLIEQGVASPHIPLTDKIPMFVGVGPGHLQGADLLLLMVLFIYCVKGAAWGPRWFPRTHVSLAIRSVLVCVALAVVIGQAHGGELRVALMEARPYVYLAVTYFLTAVFIRDRRAIRAELWGFIGSVGFKAVQGIYVWVLNRHMYPKPESFISHEASYFFVIYLILVLALWLFDQRGSMRTWATRLLPLVIFANTVNDRRAAWEMLGGALLCFGVIAYKALPIRRHLLGKSIVALVLISAVYFPVMWNSSSSLGEPARAIKSQVTPTTRDADSDTYRVQENANLELNIKQAGLLGKGFGVRIDYALPITDISQTDPLIAYIPHNDVLDVLMRMGLLGGIAMWGLIAAGIIMGCRLAMSKDRELAVIGMVVACSIVAYALMGAVDQGFFFYRIAFITGSLLGLAEAARRVAREESVPPAAAPVPAPAPLPASAPAPAVARAAVSLPLALRQALAAGVMEQRTHRPVAPERRTPAPVHAKLELLSLIHQLPGQEEQAILELIERWSRINRSQHALGHRGGESGTVFTSPSTLLHVGLEHRLVLPGEIFRRRPIPGAEIGRDGRVASSIADVVARDWIAYLLGTGRSDSPTELLLAAALVDRRLSEAGGALGHFADQRTLVRWSTGGTGKTATGTWNPPRSMTSTQQIRRPVAPVEHAHGDRLFSYLIGDVPDLSRLSDAAALDAELARIRRGHGSVRLQAFVGYGPRGRAR